MTDLYMERLETLETALLRVINDKGFDTRLRLRAKLRVTLRPKAKARR